MCYIIFWSSWDWGPHRASKGMGQGPCDSVFSFKVTFLGRVCVGMFVVVPVLRKCNRVLGSGPLQVRVPLRVPGSDLTAAGDGVRVPDG